MISRRYFRSLNTCRRQGLLVLALPLAVSLSACSSSNGENMRPDAKPTAAEMVAREKKRTKVISSQFEWAVQYYEAGSYEKAIEQFQKIERMGTDAPNYEMVSFYLGMSHFHRQEYKEAQNYLEKFLKVQSVHQESQDARMALLAVYERLSDWERLLGLAAETDKLTLFQDNRAFLKLLWARALQEKGETKGARAVLKDSSQYLDGHSAARASSPDADLDLWGRYYYTSITLDEKQCLTTTPREVGAGKKKKRLYGPWLESTVDCFRGTLDSISRDLLKNDSAWAAPAVAGLDQSFTTFGARIQEYLKEENRQLNVRRAFEEQARQNLYRLLGKIDDTMKNFKNQGVNPSALESLRKRIDLLLVSLARPS